MFAAERVHGSFERAVRLPEFVDADRISARFDKGVLSVSIPKAETAKPRTIAIENGRADAQIEEGKR